MKTLGNKILLLKMVLILFSLALTGCQKDEDEPYQVVEDIDGNIYFTVKIGNQVWMAENLKTARYRNGDSIMHIMDNGNWSSSTNGAWCNFNNIDHNDEIYGKLYNGYAVHDSRNIAPEGWHIPTDNEWLELNAYVSAHPGASGSLTKALASISFWQISSIENTAGFDLKTNNSSGFNGLPGGYRRFSGSFMAESIEEDGYWWSTDELIWNLNYNIPSVNILNESKLNMGYSVRCIKD